MVLWPNGSGASLQNLSKQFDSARDLKTKQTKNRKTKWKKFISVIQDQKCQQQSIVSGDGTLQA
jgi:hypothetical protein